VLSIGKLGQGQEAYYVETVAEGAEEYYVGRGEAPGRWMGRSAVGLELAGEVDGGDLAALLGHLDPRTGKPLTLGRSAPKVAGFDLTFCAPKSVSLLWAFGSPEVAAEVVAAHEAAVDAALGVMEAEAARVRRGKAGRDVLDADGLVAAGFRHRTSRAGDPHLHTHAVVANIGHLTADGRWSALDARHLYRWAQPVGYLYEAHLRDELTRRLGVSWGPVRNGIADLAGTSRAAIDAFSTRRREILEHLEAHAVTGGRAAQVATYATRRAKTSAGSSGDLRAAWVAQAAELGLDPVALGEPMTMWAQSRAFHLADFEILDELAGPTGVTERRSTFDRRDVVKAICDRLPAGAPVDHVLDLADEFLASDVVVAIGNAEPPSRWTTLDLLDCERRLVDMAVSVRHRRSGVVGTETATAALDAHPALSMQQRVMVAGLCRSGQGVEVVIGAAGSGKTSALAAARDAWGRDGYAVIGCALAARAAQQLQDGAGIPSTTLDRLLGDLEAGRRRLHGRTVVVVDEAGMVGTRQLESLVARAAAARAKVVLVGDPAQLPAIDAGGALAGLARRLGHHELTENHRQTADWERQVLADLREGRITEVTDSYQRHGRLDTSDDVEAVIDRWWDAHERDADVLLLAGRRDQVRTLNRSARARMRDAGRLGPDRWQVDGSAFAIGDEVVALHNDRHLGVLNGHRGHITGGDDDRINVTLTDSRRVRLPLEYAEAGHLDHGYALTIHKAQGLTADETIVLGDDTLAREHAYVALSRGRITNHLTIALADAFDDHPPDRTQPTTTADRFGRIVERSAAEDMAIEL